MVFVPLSLSLSLIASSWYRGDGRGRAGPIVIPQIIVRQLRGRANLSAGDLTVQIICGQKDQLLRIYIPYTVSNATNANAIYYSITQVSPNYTIGFPELGLRYGDFSLSTSLYR
jgi:hypothetical protein